MSNLCPQCKARFAPYQTKNGACPVCRTGTVRVAADPTVTQDAFKAITMAEELDRFVVDQYEAFEEFLRVRDRMRPQTIAERLTLEQLWSLPCAQDGPLL
jgi:hypothetical protein